MLKIAVGVLLSLMSSLTIAQADTYMLNDEQGCYVKEYVNKKFIDVPYEQFQNRKLRVTPHKKNESFMLFKADNRFYTTLKRCLKDANIEAIDEQDFSGVAESEAAVKQPEISNNKNDMRKKVTSEEDKKFYVELDIGSFSIADKNPAYPDYKKLEDYTLNGQPVLVKKIHKTDYDSKTMISIGGGRKVSNTSYAGFKFKYYQGRKEDIVDITAGGVPERLTAKLKDQFLSFLVGGRMIFLENSQLRPYVGLYAGPSIITVKNEDDKYQSLSVSAQLELGVEYFIRKNLSLAATYSYEYLGQRKFKELDKNKNGTEFETGESFKSKMDYSNSAFLVGAKFYFN